MQNNDELRLRSINYFKEYLLFLNEIKDKYIIFLGVKDTPGSKLYEEEVNLIKKFGFNSFDKQLWRMYLGIMVRGIIVLDKKGNAPEDDVSYEGVISGNRVVLLSSSWRKKNICKIEIGQRDYAVNRRGINIVVYDPVRNITIDSIVYDSHDGNQYFYRNYLKFYKNVYLEGSSVNHILPRKPERKKVHIICLGDSYFWNVLDSLVQYLMLQINVDLKIILYPFTEQEPNKKVIEYGVPHVFFKDYHVDEEKPDVLLFSCMNNIWPYKWNDVKQFVKYSKKCYCLPVTLIQNAYDKIERMSEYYIDKLKEVGIKNYITDKYMFEKIRTYRGDDGFVVSIGNPKFDSIFSKLQKKRSIPEEWEKLTGKTIILWLLDHDWDTGTNVSFDVYAKYIFEFMLENENIGMIFRPHPHFVRDTIRFGIWNESDVIELQSYIKKSPNIVWDSFPDYGISYSLCDYIFSDAESGTIVSSMVTTKPICILYRNDCIINCKNSEILNSYYEINNVMDLDNVFDMVKNKKDPMKQKRVSKISSFIEHFDGQNGRRVGEFILTDEIDS